MNLTDGSRKTDFSILHSKLIERNNVHGNVKKDINVFNILTFFSNSLKRRMATIIFPYFPQFRKFQYTYHSI